MKLLRPPKDYASIEAFYAELPDADRRLSGEIDYGVHWTEPYSLDHPRFRISLVRNTCELYEINEDRTADAHGRVRVIAVFDSVDDCEWALEGWAEACGRGGMRWLRDRLESCCVKFVCTHCIEWGAHADYSFDPDAKCRRCNHKTWQPDPVHERTRRRRPGEAIALARQHADALTAKESA